MEEVVTKPEQCSCGKENGQEIWFTDGERKWSKIMCVDCVEDFQKQCFELSELCQKAVEDLNKPLWKRALDWVFMR